MALTEQQKKHYLDQGGVCCPFCGTDDIAGDLTDYGDGSCWREITCGGCKKHWTEVYSLTGIEEGED